MPAWEPISTASMGPSFNSIRVSARKYSLKRRIASKRPGSARPMGIWKMVLPGALQEFTGLPTWQKGGVEKFNRFAYILPRQLIQDEPSRNPTAYCLDSCLGVSCF